MNLRLITVLISLLVGIFYLISGIKISLVMIAVLMGTIVLMYAVLNLLIHMGKIRVFVKYVYNFLDILLIACAVCITGGITSPFYLIYTLILLYEGMMLSKKKHILFLLALILIIYPASLIVYTGSAVNGEFLRILLVRSIFIALIGYAVLFYTGSLLKQRDNLETVLTENVSLSEKLKRFNQDLIDKVIDATRELENEVKKNKDLYEKTQHLFLSTTKALVSTIELRDPYTHGHSERMVGYCMAILEEMESGVRENIDVKENRRVLELATLLHDIGKIGIHDDVLMKTEPLSDKEWEEIKKHPEIGAHILEPISEMDAVIEIIRHHHERYDGTGYISGLKENDIPLLSRILAVADAYDAMTTERPYRKKISTDEAAEEIKNCSGTQFDPKIVNAFLKAYKKGTLAKD